MVNKEEGEKSCHRHKEAEKFLVAKSHDIGLNHKNYSSSNEVEIFKLSLEKDF